MSSNKVRRNKYYSSTIFWGVFFITLGILLLFIKASGLSFDFSWAVNLWPLIFIFLGLNFLNLPSLYRKISSAVFAIFVAVLITGVFSHSFQFGWYNRHYQKSKAIISNTSESYSNIGTIPGLNTEDLSIEASAMDLNLIGGTEQAVEVNAGTGIRNVFLYRDSTSKNIDLQYDQFEGNYISDYTRKSTVKLNNSKLWNLSVEAGASNISSDFSSTKVREIHMDAGASNIYCKFGALCDTVKITLEAGASNVKLMIPKYYACEINASMGLSYLNSEGFIADGEDNYKTENFNGNPKVFLITIDGGVSKFEVIRY